MSDVPIEYQKHINSEEYDHLPRKTKEYNKYYSDIKRETNPDSTLEGCPSLDSIDVILSIVIITLDLGALLICLSTCNEILSVLRTLTATRSNTTTITSSENQDNPSTSSGAVGDAHVSQPYYYNAEPDESNQYDEMLGFEDELPAPPPIDWSEVPEGEPDPEAIPSWAVIPEYLNFDRTG